MNIEKAIEIQEHFISWRDGKYFMVKYSPDEIQESARIILSEFKKLHLQNVIGCAITEVKNICAITPEINMSNYNHDDVQVVNNALNAINDIVDPLIVE